MKIQNKGKDLKKQMTISSSISSILYKNKKLEQRKRMSKIKEEAQKKKSISNSKNSKFSVSKSPIRLIEQGGKVKKEGVNKNTMKITKYNLDPYILPLMKTRILSPVSRARKVLGKTPKLDKKLK